MQEWVRGGNLVGEEPAHRSKISNLSPARGTNEGIFVGISGLDMYARMQQNFCRVFSQNLTHHKRFKHPPISEPTMAMRTQLVRLARARAAHFSSSSKPLGEVPLKDGVRGALSSLSPLGADSVAASPAFLTQPKVPKSHADQLCKVLLQFSFFFQAP